MHFSRHRRALCAGVALLLFVPSAKAVDHPIVAGFERFHAAEKGDLARGGRLLLGELNCVSCHQSATGSAARKLAPTLDGLANRVRIGWLKKYLADPQAVKPGSTMPNVFANDADKGSKVEALVHFLAASGSVRHERADIKGIILGKDLYSKVGCVACHGPRDLLGQPEKMLPPYAVPLGDLKNKYTIASLAKFLDNPLQVRPSGRMPQVVNGKDARDIANYLLQGIKITLPQGIGTTNFAYYEGSWTTLPDFSKLKPKATGTGDAFDISVARRTSSFGMKFEGYLKIEKEGAFQFTTTSDDGSRLLIDGKVVVNNDGTHPPQSASGTARLSKGKHKVAVEFFQGDGGAELAVEVEGPGLAQQHLAGLVSSTESDLDRKPDLKKLVNEDDVLDVKPDLVEKGRALFASAGCANCHQMTGQKPLASSLAAATLEKLKGEGGCLAEKPTKGAPWYGLSTLQRNALAAAIKQPVAESTDPAAVIARTMLTMNCYACHARDKTGGPTEELNKFFTTSQPEMGDEARIPPPLDLVGAKLNPEYVKSILDKGVKDRPYMHTRMPGFGDANVGILTAAFRSLDKLSAVAPVSFETTETKVKAAGRLMLGEQAYACVKCHTYAGNKAEGVQGIDMLLMPKRLQRDWFYAYLLDPQKIRPGTRMPTGWPDGMSTLKSVFNGNTDQQIEAIWAYLKLGPSAQLPVGVGGRKSIPLFPFKEAIIYRNFIQGAGPRGIAVGYPEKVHLAFDANDMRLAMLWQGAFIDAAKHWTDRGSGYEGPLGDNILHLASGVPFTILERPDSPWPTTRAKDQGYRFLGYRLTPDERPTFDYAFKSIKIEDTPHPVGGMDPFMKRTINLTAAEPIGNLTFRAAVGNKIESTGDGWYKIDGWKMKIDSDGTPLIRSIGGKSELLVPILFKDGKAQITQEFVW